MLTPPPDLPPETIAAAVGVDAAAMVYQPVGFGSHHWSVGQEWFVTVDELDARRLSVGETRETAFDRLGAALAAASSVGDSYAVPPAGPLVRLGAYAAIRYPFVAGESYGFALYGPGEHREAVLRLLIGVHTTAFDRLRRDDFTVPHRDALEATLGGSVAGHAGPFEQRAAALINDNAGPIRKLLDRYDALAAVADPGRAVLTHGEPHTGNTLRTAAGWRLIDWETALIAPPERDLWLLGGDLSAYTDATGVAVRPELLEMYRLRWDIADLSIDVDRFRRPHTGNADDVECLSILEKVVGSLGSPAAQ